MGHCGYDLSMLLTAANTCQTVDGIAAREEGSGAWLICIRRWKLANGKCQLKLLHGPKVAHND